MKEVYIVSAVRTPIGSLEGALAPLSASQLGSIVIKAAVERAGIQPAMVQEAFMGNVLSAGVGQAPTKQAVLGAGLPNTIPCTTINKVCASGMKAIMIGAQSILLGDNDIVVAGGMESMSNVPYYLSKARRGYRLGHAELWDGIIKDGLWDPYKNFHMGNAAELCAKEYSISREEQDAYAIASYQRAAAAHQKGWFANEIIPVEISSEKGTVVIVKEDEEYKKVNYDKIPHLKPAFQKEGTVTAANASTISDGAAAVVLMSKEKAEALGVKPLAKILSYADAAQAPEWFTTAPAKAIPRALAKAKKDIQEVDYFEINEAFSVVALANTKQLQLNPEKVNVYGGAVSLGHPIGCSGARIIVTLINILRNNTARLGVAGICNGGGGASAVVIERIG